jgi:hypothetical protein
MTDVVVPATTGLGADQHRRSRRATRSVLIAAWAVPVLVVGQFAMLAIVPVVLAQTATIRHARLRPLRPWTVALTTAYALALILWAIGPDRAPSLSKDMHPVSAALIVAAAFASIFAVHVERRRSRVLGGLVDE